MKRILTLIGICLLPLIQEGNVCLFRLEIAKVAQQLNPSMVQTSFSTVSECMNQAWNVSWERFYRENTQLFYDYLTSYETGHGLDHLPTANEVSRQYPNPYGYGTGMEDCMISAGVMLSMIADQYAVTKNGSLRKYAYSVFKGIQRCATVHGVPGFLARGVCSEDIKSIYVNSSRDQYTHVVYGLWCYFHSPLCNSKTRKEVGKILSAFADRMKQNVTPENDYDFLRADGSHDNRGISRMWNVKGHEAARLPMIYAAAWNTTGNREYYELYRKYLEPAVRQSFVVEEWQPTYALLQMQCSLELLESMEQDSELKKQMCEIMAMISRRCSERAVTADATAQKLDLTMVGSDWRTGDGLSPKGEYRKVWYCIRESGEAALTQLMLREEVFSEEQKTLLTHAITRLDYGHVSSSGIFYLQGAYWKAYRLGVFAKEDK